MALPRRRCLLEYGEAVRNALQSHEMKPEGPEVIALGTRNARVLFLMAGLIFCRDGHLIRC